MRSPVSFSLHTWK